MGASCGGVLGRVGALCLFVSFEVCDDHCLWFWHDVWCGSHSLKELYPALLVL